MFEKLFTKIVDPDYGTYFQPTVAGFTVLAVIMVLVLLIAVMLTANKGAKMKTKDLAFCALAMALAFVTSTFMKLFDMPMGGSVTFFSMLFITLVGYWYGLRTGLMTAISYGLLQLVTDPWIISVPQVLFDYVFAFGALGLSGLFSNSKHGLVKGYLVGIIGRFFFSFLSGVLFFASSAEAYNMSVYVYSICYNGAYIGAEAVMTVVLLCVPAISKALGQVKRLAVDSSGVKKSVA